MVFLAQHKSRGGGRGRVPVAWCVAVLALSACSRKDAPRPARQVRPGGPRLEIRLAASRRLRLRLPPGARVFDAASDGFLPASVALPPAGGDLEVGLRDGRIVLGERILSGPLEIAPGPAAPPPGGAPDGPDALLGLLVSSPGGASRARLFRGHFVVAAQEDLLELANRLSLEEYLAGVVGSEMPASSYPVEALKAQAVAARTYALYGIIEARQQGRTARFAGDERFQVYGGAGREHPRVLRAVRETAGEVLTFEGTLFRTYFHSTCGGRTADASSVFAEPDIPPLRGVVCGACDGSRYARWKVGWSTSDLAGALQPWLATRNVALGEIVDLIVADRFRGGRVKYLLVRHSKGSFEIRGSRFRALTGAIDGVGLRSTSFNVSKEGGAFVFEGAGWGHGVGMCQVGAGRMGKARGYREILAHYYPESSISKVY